jgi:hypothetical protein
VYGHLSSAWCARLYLIADELKWVTNHPRFGCGRSNLSSLGSVLLPSAGTTENVDGTGLSTPLLSMVCGKRPHCASLLACICFEDTLCTHVLLYIASSTLVLSGLPHCLRRVFYSFSSPCTSQYYGGNACHTVFGKSVASGTYLLSLLYFDVRGDLRATSKRSRARFMLDWPTNFK